MGALPPVLARPARQLAGRRLEIPGGQRLQAGGLHPGHRPDQARPGGSGDQVHAAAPSPIRPVVTSCGLATARAGLSPTESMPNMPATGRPTAARTPETGPVVLPQRSPVAGR